MACAYALTVAPSSPATGRRRFCLVGIDGLLLNIALEPGLAPNLARLHAQGTARTLQMSVPTLSGPGWSTLLTGASMQQHGVTDNYFAGSRLPWIPDLLSQAAAADPSTITFAAAGWTALVDPAGAGPVIHTRPDQRRAGLHHVVVRDGELYGYANVDPEIATVADYALRERPHPDAMFVYFCSVDEAGHLYGVGEEYRRAIRRVDGYLGRIRSRLAALAADGEQWLLAVVTDHGHRLEGGHGGDSAAERSSFLIGAGIGRPNPVWARELQPTDVCGAVLSG